MKSKKYEIDMTEGPLFRKIVVFSLPLVLTGILQALYNAADLVIVGHYEGHVALAAVGNTSALANLVIGLFMGLSVGAGVCAAQNIGAKKYGKVSKVVHTSFITSIILGIAVAVFGIIFAKDFLLMMKTPESVIEYSTLYIRIIFFGAPTLMLYNFCAAILRSTGDTKHPLMFLLISGIVNVILNVIMVAGFKMGVAGVAWATVISQLLGAVMIVVYMAKSDSYIKIRLKNMKISWEELGIILKIGLPSGLQGCIFSLSNVIIQSSVNSFGDVVMAGNSAAQNLEGFIWVAMNSVHQAALTFIGQNVGAKKYNRLGKVTVNCLVVVTCVWAALTAILFTFRYPLLSLYSNGDAEVVNAGLVRMGLIVPTYFLAGHMDVLSGILRGMGKSFSAMMFTLFGTCGIRVIWIFTVFKMFPSPTSVYLSYPISWIVGIVCQAVMIAILYKKTLKIGEIPQSRFKLKSKEKGL